MAFLSPLFSLLFLFYLNLVPRRGARALSLSQGFFGHLRLWMQLFPARQFIVVDSDVLSDASPVEEEVLKFLRDEMVCRGRGGRFCSSAGGNAGRRRAGTTARPKAVL